MYLLSVKLEVERDKINEFKSSITTLINKQQTHGKPHGILYCSLSLKNIFFYQEEWADYDKMEEHIDSDWFKTLLGCAKSLGKNLGSEIINIESKQIIN